MGDSSRHGLTKLPSVDYEKTTDYPTLFYTTATMISHLPSFLAGSAFSGTAFLMIDRHLSYRKHSHQEWPLKDKTEEYVKAQWQGIAERSNFRAAATSPRAMVPSFLDLYDGGVEAMREFFAVR